MEVRWVVEAVDNNWVASLTFVSFNAREQEQLAAYGPFKLDAGGSITGDEDHTLPVNEILIPDQLPVKVVYSVQELGNTSAKDRAASWESTMRARLAAALTAWKATDPTVGESRTNQTLT